MKKIIILLLPLILFACNNSESHQKIELIDKKQSVKDTAEIEGYQPEQAVNFSHSIHNEDVGIDCKYCHKQSSSEENMTPSHSLCLICHTVEMGDLNSDNERDLINQISDSIEAQDNAIAWRRVTTLPANFREDLHKVQNHDE